MASQENKNVDTEQAATIRNHVVQGLGGTAAKEALLLAAKEMLYDQLKAQGSLDNNKAILNAKKTLEQLGAELDKSDGRPVSVNSGFGEKSANLETVLSSGRGVTSGDIKSLQDVLEARVNNIAASENPIAVVSGLYQSGMKAPRLKASSKEIVEFDAKLASTAEIKESAQQPAAGAATGEDRIKELTAIAQKAYDEKPGRKEPFPAEDFSAALDMYLKTPTLHPKLAGSIDMERTMQKIGKQFRADGTPSGPQAILMSAMGELLNAEASMKENATKALFEAIRMPDAKVSLANIDNALSYGANINGRSAEGDSKGETPLTYAIRQREVKAGEINIAAELVSRKADVTLPDKDGVQPRDLANSKGDKDTLNAINGTGDKDPDWAKKSDSPNDSKSSGQSGDKSQGSSADGSEQSTSGKGDSSSTTDAVKNFGKEHAEKLAIGGGILTAVGVALGMKSRGKEPQEGEEKKSSVMSWVLGAAGVGAAAWGLYNMVSKGKAPGMAK